MSSGICKVNSFVNKLISLPIMYNASTNIVHSHGRKILVNYELSLRPALKKCVGMQERTLMGTLQVDPPNLLGKLFPAPSKSR